MFEDSSIFSQLNQDTTTTTTTTTNMCHEETLSDPDWEQLEEKEEASNKKPKIGSTSRIKKDSIFFNIILELFF